MKKGILILLVFLFSGIVVLYGKRIRHMVVEKPEIKTIRFSVYAGTDYSTFLYKKSNAKVILSVYKFVDDRQELVWEGEVNKGAIKNYPTLNGALFQEVNIHNVYDRNETLAAYYRVVYDSRGSKFSYEEGLSLAAGSNIDSLKIPI